MRLARIIGLLAPVLMVGCDDEFNYNTSHGGAVEGEGIDAVIDVMDGNCVGCHTGESASAGLDLATDFCGEVLDGRLVIPGDSAASVLYQRISNEASSMPPTGLMDQSNIDLVRDWIDAGADCSESGGTGGGTGGADEGSGTGGDPSGEDLFSASCAGCHGASGEGLSAPALAYVVPEHDQASLEAVILNGSGTMPAVSGVTAEEAALIAEYVLATWGQ